MKNIPTPDGAFTLQASPQRIVSLVPSQTELLFDLGLEERIVGITKFCVHPIHFKRTKCIIGGTKKVNYEKIRALKPDLIIGNKEENTLEMVLELQKICPVWVTDITNLNDNNKMIFDFGNHLGCEEKARELIEKIENAFLNFTAFVASRMSIRTIYLIWQNPYMAAGTDTFINEMLKLNRFDNCCTQNRYPEMTTNNIIDSNPELILLSSEPFPFKKKHVLEITKATKINAIIVDGEMFSWYGSRVLKAFDYFERLHHQLKQ